MAKKDKKGATDRRQDLPKKLQALLDHEISTTVLEFMDGGEGIPRIKRFCDQSGFLISERYLYELRNWRRQQRTESDAVEEFLTPGRPSKMLLNRSETKPLGASAKIKSDLDFCDLVIQTGAEQLRQKIQEDCVDIEIQDVFEAIALKHKLTDGALYQMTNYGIEYLQSITEQNYINMMRLVFEYTPKDAHKEILHKLDIEEESFYRSTDYYEEYLRSKGFSEKEIEVKLHEKNNQAYPGMPSI